MGADNTGRRDQESEIENVSEHSGEAYMNTRFRGRKHVKVYELDVVRKSMKSILKRHGK